MLGYRPSQILWWTAPPSSSSSSWWKTPPTSTSFSSWYRRRSQMSTFFSGLGNLIWWRNNSRLFLTFSHQPAFFCFHHFHFLFSPFSPEPICRRKTQKEISQCLLLSRRERPAEAMTTTTKNQPQKSVLLTSCSSSRTGSFRGAGRWKTDTSEWRVEYDRTDNGGPTDPNQPVGTLRQKKNSQVGSFSFFSLFLGYN